MASYSRQLKILFEDSPYRDILNGVALSSNVNENALDFFKPCGGWLKVFEQLEKELKFLDKFKDRHLLILIDFDEKFESRYDKFLKSIPSQYQNRVFILGVDNKESEALKSLFKMPNFEKIGKKLIKDCPDSDLSNWKNKHLQCNEFEIKRMKKCGVFDWLFNN